ncbi:hypothetical protein [Ehrlichia ruminantium]|nr:hypothetical protein [Ehrlichia ruminantium]
MRNKVISKVCLLNLQKCFLCAYSRPIGGNLSHEFHILANY